jgi:hypothetical protein
VRFTEKKRTQRAAFWIKSLRFIPQPQEDLLGDVLGQAIVFENLSAQSIDRVPKSVINPRKRCLVALQYSAEVTGIGCRDCLGNRG